VSGSERGKNDWIGIVRKNPIEEGPE